MVYLLQLTKMGALAALVALVAVREWSALTAATIGVGVFYTLIARVS